MVLEPLKQQQFRTAGTEAVNNPEFVTQVIVVLSQCWVSYFLKVTCYSYKLLHEKSNLLQLLLHFNSNKLLYKLLYR